MAVQPQAAAAARVYRPTPLQLLQPPRARLRLEALLWRASAALRGRRLLLALLLVPAPDNPCQLRRCRRWVTCLRRSLAR